MKIPLDFDVVGKAAPDYNKGTSPFENPQIAPYEKAIPETPGEKAVNSTEPDMIDKAPPLKPKSGQGYVA